MQVKGEGSDIDTKQPSVESLKDPILESLSRFSDNLVSILDPNSRTSCIQVY